MTDTAAVVEVDNDRELVRHVLQSMSDRISGRTSTQLVTNAPFHTPSPVDVPDAPMPDPTAVPDSTSPPTAPTHASSSDYAWGGYENGRIPTKALKKIGQGNHRLETGAADAWIAMRAAAAADGVTLTLTDSYRSYDQQVAVRNSKGHLVATAKPGTSVHGWGRAVDANVKDPATLRWLQTNGPKFGWVNPGWAKASGKNHEPWHYEWVGGANG